MKINKQYIENLPLIKQGLNFIKINSFPGFFGIPIYDILLFIINELRREKIMFRANSIAFSFFVSIFPAIIVVINLLVFLPIRGGVSTLEESLQNVLPAEAHEFLFSTINNIFEQPEVGLLSLSFLLAIYISSNGMMAMMHSFDKSYETTFKKRSDFHKRLRAIMLTGMLSVLLALSITLIIGGKFVIQWVAEINTGDSQISTLALSALRWVIILSTFYSFIALIYRYGPAVNIKSGLFTAGTTVATVLSILTSILFSVYVNNFGNYNTIYGSIGAIIVLLLWLQLNSFILLLGFELNTSIAVNRDLKKLRDKEILEID